MRYGNKEIENKESSNSEQRGHSNAAFSSPHPFLFLFTRLLTNIYRKIVEHYIQKIKNSLPQIKRDVVYLVLQYQTLYSDFLSSSLVLQHVHYSLYLFISNIRLPFYETRFLSANQNIRHITGLYIQIIKKYGKAIRNCKVVSKSGFGGLRVSVLATGTQVRGFKPGRSRRIFRVRLPSGGK